MPERMLAGWAGWMDAGGIAASTIRLRRYAVLAFARDHDLRAATFDDVVAYLALPGRGTDARRSIRSALRSFYRWANAAGVIDHDPTDMTLAIRAKPGAPRPCPEEAITAAAQLATPEQMLMLLLGAYGGLRRAEIAAVHSRDILGDSLYVRGKGARERVVPIHPRVAPLLTFDGWAFPSPRRAGQHVTADYVANRLERILPDPWTAHSLRHRFATQVYRATHDLRALQKLLGHSSLATTARYVLVEDDALTRAVRAVA